MKGRNSSCINIRLGMDDIKLLTDKALSKGYETPGTYVKSMILKSLHSDSTLNGYSGSTTDTVNHSGSTIPIYNPAVHKAGDRVLVRQGKRLIESIVPEIDADGHQYEG